MKVVRGIVVAAVAMSIAGAASASSLGVKFWNPEIDGTDDPALHLGVTASLSLGDAMWMSGMFLAGTFEDVAGLPGNDVDTADAEVVIGFTTSIFDLGVGGRYTRWADPDDSSDEFIIWGPMAYAALGSTFGNAPVGWYFGGSYMFKDLGDAFADDWSSTYEHYNIEGGLFLAYEALSATLGYRIKEFTDSDVDLEFKGIAGSLGFGF